MTPLEAYELSLRGHEICTDIQDLFTEFRYESDRYDEAISELEVVLKILIDERYYSYHSNLIERAGDLLNPNEYNNKKPNINLPDLVKHLELFSIPPYVAINYLYGEEFNTLAVRAALRRGVFENATSTSWCVMLKELAKKSDLGHWIELSESLFQISTNATQRVGAILSIGYFNVIFIAQNRINLGNHIEKLLNANVSPIDLGRLSAIEDVSVHDLQSYRALKSVGHLGLVHQFLDAEISTTNVEETYHLQNLIAEFKWDPSEKSIRQMCRARPSYYGNNAFGIAIHLLQLPHLPAGVTLPAWELNDIAKLLLMDGSVYPLGKINFNKCLVGEMVNNSVRSTKDKNPYAYLRSLGVADDLLMASSVLREHRMGSDLGL